MNLVKNVKNKWAARKFKKLEKEVIQLRKETSWIPSQQDSSSSADTCKDSIAGKHLITETKDKNERKEKGDGKKTQIRKKSPVKINCARKDQSKSRSGLITEKAPDGEVQTMMRKRGNQKGETSCHVEPNDICEKCIEKRICNTNRKLPKKYRLRVGNEKEWIEKIKTLMEKQNKKPLGQQLTELMPLVRNHRDIKNAIKAKKIAVRRNSNEESMRKFLDRLAELYGQNGNKTLNRKSNRRIKCHKCKKRGHLRKNCSIMV